MRDEPAGTVTSGGRPAPLGARGAGLTGEPLTALVRPRVLLGVLVVALAGYAALAADVVNGGAFSELDAEVDSSTWEVPNVFRVLQDAGGVARDEMFRAFNMGVGMVVACEPSDVAAVLDRARDADTPAWSLGRVVRGQGRVIIR